MAAREQLADAYSKGAAAGREGAPATSCPYPAGLLRATWIRGYVRHRPRPTDRDA